MKKERVTREFGFCRPVLITLPESIVLILHLAVDVKSLWALGKAYPWPVVRECPACGGRRLWSHGYVTRYFEGFADIFWVKRYRCPECSSVHTSRPSGFLRGIRYCAGVVVSSLVSKVNNGFWVSSVVRQVQQYWYRLLRLFAFRSSFRCLSVEDIRSFLSRRTNRLEDFAPLLL